MAAAVTKTEWLVWKEGYVLMSNPDRRFWWAGRITSVVKHASPITRLVPFFSSSRIHPVTSFVEGGHERCTLTAPASNRLKAWCTVT